MINIINNFDPDIIIFGGGITTAFNFFQTAMTKTITNKSFLTLPIIKKLIISMSI